MNDGLTEEPAAFSPEESLQVLDALNELNYADPSPHDLLTNDSGDETSEYSGGSPTSGNFFTQEPGQPADEGDVLNAFGHGPQPADEGDVLNVFGHGPQPADEGDVLNVFGRGVSADDHVDGGPGDAQPDVAGAEAALHTSPEDLARQSIAAEHAALRADSEHTTEPNVADDATHIEGGKGDAQEASGHVPKPDHQDSTAQPAPSVPPKPVEQTPEMQTLKNINDDDYRTTMSMLNNLRV